MLPLYQQIADGEMTDIKFSTIEEPDPINQLYKIIEKIDNLRLRDFLKTDIDYAVKKFGDEK